MRKNKKEIGISKVADVISMVMMFNILSIVSLSQPHQVGFSGIYDVPVIKNNDLLTFNK